MVESWPKHAKQAKTMLTIKCTMRGVPRHRDTAVWGARQYQEMVESTNRYMLLQERRCNDIDKWSIKLQYGLWEPVYMQTGQASHTRTCKASRKWYSPTAGQPAALQAIVLHIVGSLKHEYAQGSLAHTHGHSLWPKGARHDSQQG